MSARTADPEVTAAQADSARVAAQVDDLEEGLASGRRSVSAVALNKARDLMRHAELTLAGKQAKAEREAAQARLEALGQLGAQVDALAASAPGRLEERLRALAAAAEAARAEIALHNAQLADLAEAARELAVEPPAPGGPRESSGFIAFAGHGVQHERTAVHPVADPAAVITLAVAGDVPGALAEALPVRVADPPRRAEHYLRSASGALITAGDITPALEAQIRAGQLRHLTEPEIAAYLRGDLT